MDVKIWSPRWMGRQNVYSYGCGSFFCFVILFTRCLAIEPVPRCEYIASKISTERGRGVGGPGFPVVESSALPGARSSPLRTLAETHWTTTGIVSDKCSGRYRGGVSFCQCDAVMRPLHQICFSLSLSFINPFGQIADVVPFVASIGQGTLDRTACLRVPRMRKR